jgi:hypothetical protein
MTDPPGAPATGPEDSDIAHMQAWSAQYELSRELGAAIDKVTAGRSDAFGAALAAYLIEHLSERLRMYLRLPESDVKAGGDG